MASTLNATLSGYDIPGAFVVICKCVATDGVDKIESNGSVGGNRQCTFRRAPALSSVWELFRGEGALLPWLGSIPCVAPAHGEAVHHRHAFHFHFQLIERVVWTSDKFCHLEVKVIGWEAQPEVVSHRTVPLSTACVVEIGIP